MQEADLVLVAVKPQVAEAVFRELGVALTDARERCFVSLVTGWSRQRITQVGLKKHSAHDPQHIATESYLLINTIRCYRCPSSRKMGEDGARW